MSEKRYAQWFEKDIRYLQTILLDPKKIEGIILKLSDVPLNPMVLNALDTLSFGEGDYARDYNRIVVFKQCEEQLELRSSGRLQVLSHYSFTRGSWIVGRSEIAEIPKPLKNLLVKGDFKKAYNWLVDDVEADASSASEEEADGFSPGDEDPDNQQPSRRRSEEEQDDEIARMKQHLRELEGRIEMLERELKQRPKGGSTSLKDIGSKSDQTGNVNDFLRRHFKKGGMTPLKKARKKPGWMQNYVKQLEIKTVHVCKSCGRKSNKGCCWEYRSSNRTTRQMIVGWSAN